MNRLYTPIGKKINFNLAYEEKAYRLPDCIIWMAFSLRPWESAFELLSTLQAHEDLYQYVPGNFNFSP